MKNRRCMCFGYIFPLVRFFVNCHFLSFFFFCYLPACYNLSGLIVTSPLPPGSIGHVGIGDLRDFVARFGSVSASTSIEPAPPSLLGLLLIHIVE